MKILEWECTKCGTRIISKSWMTHQMDVCKCKACGVDLEEYYCRKYDNSYFKIIRSKKVSELEFGERRELLDCGTYGKNGDGPYSRIKIKDMKTEHIKAILNEPYPIHSRFIITFKEELKYREE